MENFKSIPSTPRKRLALFLSLIMIFSMTASWFTPASIVLAAENPSTNVALNEVAIQASSNNPDQPFFAGTYNPQLATDGLFNNANNFVDYSGAGYIQVDLGVVCELDYIQLYRYFTGGRTYLNNIVAVSLTEEGFTSGAGRTILYNTDTTNVHGLGVGTDAAYSETSSGRRFDTTGLSARYVRVYALGNNVNIYSHVVEILVYGWSPAPNMTALQTLYNGLKDTANDNYYSGYWNRFVTALNEAKAILDGPNVKQSVVDAAYEALDSAFKGLKDPLIIPKPVSYIAGNGRFSLADTSKFIVSVNDAADADAAINAAEYLASKMRPSTGYALPVATSGTATAIDITFKTIPKTQALAQDVDFATTGNEGYVLVSDANGVLLTAYTAEGLFRGVQTIRQLLPAAIEKQSVTTGVAWGLSYANIIDYPRYAFRSIQIDVSRHFHPKEVIMRELDLMAQYKMSELHLHLSDDQGWRIAIDAYPELTEFGGAGKDYTMTRYNTPLVSGLSRLAPGSLFYGQTGYYTKEDYQEILTYAGERYIEIIPEIEMPSHCFAQNYALPLLNKDGILPELGIRYMWTDTVGQSVCMNTEINKYTVEFINTMFKELADMTPGKYIHVGGDEANNKTDMPDAIYDIVSKATIDAVRDNNKLSIQWNQSGSSSREYPWADVIQNWATGSNPANAVSRAVAKGSKVIASMADQVYLDHITHTQMPIGHSWAASAGVPIIKTYQLEPENAVPVASRDQGIVIGVEAPLWTEAIGSQQAIEILVYPRLASIAEVAWSPKADRLTATTNNPEWLGFKERLAAQGERLTNEGVVFMNETTIWPAKTVTGRTLNVPYTDPLTTPINTLLKGKIDFDKKTAEDDNVLLKQMSSPTQGTLTIDEDGNWSYMPNAGFVGRDSFVVAFMVEGYGIPMGPTTSASSSTRGRTQWNGLTTISISVTAEEDAVYPVTVKAEAVSSTNLKLSFVPPVPDLLLTNFSVPGATVRIAESHDNGSTYLLVTTRRNESVADKLEIINKEGYTFNAVDLGVSHNIVPKPAEFIDYEGTFEIKATTKIFVSEEAKGVADFLAQKLRTSTGFSLPVVTSGESSADDINLKLIDKTADLPMAYNYGSTASDYEKVGDEGYRLYVDINEGVVLSAYTAEGLFRGVQTIRQLLPAEIEKSTVVTAAKWTVPYCDVVDYPRYGFRSMMLDVARHFQTKEEVMRQIDQMAQYKINYVHLHLTDNQGFRIAFDKYPELTDFGGATKNMSSGNYNTANVVPGHPASASRFAPGSINDGKPGYYTKADYKEIIDYAAERFVQIIPEIEFPGHSVAELFSLPMLTTNPPYSVGLHNNGGNSNLFINDPYTNAYTAKFITDIMNELAAMTPGDYIHMGGDEVYNMTPLDYASATKYVLDAIKDTGKLSIQWVQDNATTNVYPAPDVIQNWKDSYDSLRFINNAVQAGSKIIANLSDHTYFDHMVSRAMPLGATWARRGGILQTDWAYAWDPEQAAPEGYEDRVIGVEACLWSETIGSETAVDILLYPRLQGLAEIGWSQKEGRAEYTTSNPSNQLANQNKPSWINFKKRLAAQGPRMSYQGIDFMNDVTVWPLRTIDVTTRNAPFTAPLSTNINTPLSGKFEFAATTAEGDTVIISKASEPTQGTVQLTPDGSWTYTPNKGFIGRDSFVVAYSAEGFGIPMGRVLSSGWGTAQYDGFTTISIDVKGDAEVVYPVVVTAEAISEYNIKVTLNPPVPGMWANTTNQGVTNSPNFALSELKVKYAETYDNGRTYVLITEPRVSGKTYTLSVTKSGYGFTTTPIAYGTSVVAAITDTIVNGYSANVMTTLSIAGEAVSNFKVNLFGVEYDGGLISLTADMVPVAGAYGVLFIVDDAVVATARIVVAAKNDNIWTATVLAVADVENETQIRFAADIGPAPKGYAVTVNAAPKTFDQVGNTLQIHNYAAAPDDVIVVSGVMYVKLFPSYSFTFTVTV